MQLMDDYVSDVFSLACHCFRASAWCFKGRAGNFFVGFKLELVYASTAAHHID